MDDVWVSDGTPLQNDLVPCRICGRTFIAATRLKHEPICQKNTAKRRRAFDSSRQRAEGTDISTLKPLKPRPEPPKKPSNWRRKHEEFITTIRAAKGLTQVMKEGRPLPPPPPPSYNPDYIQCPYCQRRFSQSAADRHISFCKEQSARITKPKLAAVKGKPAAQTQFKSPVLKKTNSPSSTPPASTRIPLPSVSGKTVSGFATPKGNTSPASEYKLREGSPAKRLGAINHPTGGASGIRARTLTPPSVTRNITSTALVNRKKGYNAENYTRNNIKSGFDTGDDSLTLNDRSIKSSDQNQLSRFCHDCGTKYPVEWAKFCCECGVRRMTL
ncbi:zinc finger C2HC domain-containing protein 1A [Callorhinchus milii]|uniref:Zinc finger C2HC domain-containing protein 1A n=1 Tax=Callorhinchus milii TaxID=7868 RepID=A0A4W3GXG7_CALMI|nr:zinc finger C2HC domain-containing protein 1A [Callorhinchus milii]|eukprot:gi/632958350/ref/XP_007894985.1/ PREDICTED: zinc finger C2HC domain-containing protein 1A [Callorhinchus milii]